MRTKIALFSLFLGLIYMACEDSLNNVGIGILPDEDKISMFDTTFLITSSTVKVDSIYAKSVNGYLGDFYDPTYGNIKSGYICQFYAPESNAFPDSIIDEKVDSILLKVSYKTWVGDSLTPMEVTAFPVVKALDKHYYTNMNPAQYCDLAHPWAKQGYTARNLNMSDSLYSAIKASSDQYFEVSIRLPQSLGQAFYDEFKKPEPNAYSSLEDFVKFFPGVYLTNTYGSGNLLSVAYTDIYVYFNYNRTTTDVNGDDSVYVDKGSTVFTVTKEVIQLNSFKNTHEEELLKPNDTKTYMKTPAGVFTKVVIPIPEIKKVIGDKKFSSVQLSFSAYPKEDGEYLSFPGDPSIASSRARAKVLLIQPDSVKTFFEEQRAADSKTTYTTTFNNSTYSYIFSNIAGVIQNAIKEKPDQNLELLLIPVATQYYSSSSTVVDYATSHYLSPSAVTLKKGGDNMKIKVVATNLAIND